MDDHQPSQPDSILLYRYLDAKAAMKTLESGSFKVGRIRDFNDVFEWRFGITGIVPEGEPVAQACIESCLDWMHATFGILCFSDTYSEPVLWSHYADRHRGVALEFDYLRDERLIQMRYTHERPVVDACRLHYPNEFEPYMKPILNQLLTQKSSGWSYEREFRSFVRLQDCEIVDGAHTIRIPDNFLKRVILGYRCPLEERDVIRALKKIGAEATELVRAKISRDSYAVCL